MIEKRLFVGNLPLNISEKKIKKKFSGYGNVLDVEVKHRKDATDNVISTFAFVNIQADIANLNDCKYLKDNEFHFLFNTHGN